MAKPLFICGVFLLVAARSIAGGYIKTSPNPLGRQTEWICEKCSRPTSLDSIPMLYSYFRSSASWRVRIALAYKGIEYDYKPVNLIKDGGQQKTEEYAAVNPMCQVPSLIIDGTTLTQSLPIMEYLEETRPEKNILPKDPVARAQVRRVSEVINAGIQPIQNLPVMVMVGEWCGDANKKIEWSKYWITRGFKALEQILKDTAGTFCVGDEVTMADFCLVPQVYNANRFKVDMSEFPIISRVHEECVKLEYMQAADPLMQPDCPEDLKN